MKIRAQQRAVLGRASQGDMSCRLVAHVRQAFPDAFTRMGEEQVRQWVRLGIDRAAALGLEAEYDVLRYVDLMFLLGRDFEGDTDLAWAQEILRDASASPAEKLDRLFEHVRAP